MVLAPDDNSLFRVSTPLVSICTPTYQRPELLRRAIASCLAQTCGDFEMVITDNSTDDRSGAVVAAFNDPRLRYHKNKTNLGPFANFIKLWCCGLFGPEVWHRFNDINLLFSGFIQSAH